MTPTQKVAYTATLTAEAFGDSSKVSSSYTADKSSRQVARNIATAYTLHSSVACSQAAHVTLGFKVYSFLVEQTNSEERRTLVLGDADELKFLGVPAYQLGSHRNAGDILVDLTVDLLSSWKCGGLL